MSPCVRLIGLFFYLLALAARLDAATYYVATTGSDANSCGAATSTTTPKLTVGGGLGCLAAGDTLQIRAGTYIEANTFATNGTAGSHIAITNFPSESPVISGNSWTVPALDSGTLLLITGSFVDVSSLEVKESKGVGCANTGPNVTWTGMNCHHHMENGLLIQGNNSTVDNSDVHDSVLCHQNGAFQAPPCPQTTWSTGLSAARAPNNVTITNSRIYNNWGEGLSTFAATNITMHGNDVHDNWAANIYIQDTTGTVVDANKVYNGPWQSGGSPMFGFTSDGFAPPGILYGTEGESPSPANNKIYNNLIWNNKRCFYVWSGDFINSIFDNNTCVDQQAVAGLQFTGAAGSGSEVKNNIIYQTTGDPIGTGDCTGITFDYNLWYNSSPTACMQGVHDVSADPLLVDRTNHDYHLTINSPAKDVGLTIASFNVDYAGVSRPQGSAWDIGAYEFVSATPSSPLHVRIITTPYRLRWDQLTADTVTGFRVCVDTQTGTACPDVGLPTGATVSDTYPNYLSYTYSFPSTGSPGRHSLTVEAYNGSSLSAPSPSPLVVTVTWK